ncbi:hypothetical protein COT75_02515 [Candidatus Beckwithbacteria bacterium CG10_big_fil_rev_8_21_14_0_10_34_10]|uniref:CMP/dCMP-type deaminase domain-containing protein n=1 Tax=Candidatus Beckwithbacteria bacterium CG10_big_fil_rev_8_21_14_0_10_34_10 TaxID=1974495 RepID=A0A2H0W9C6_9BACT|nr:MAG: hypothetical protein COT75_02515 [Candidatus Beckwithbacteria bacterium CG10_big_fil_rev_8_21_14_0_10_34_10]
MFKFKKIKDKLVYQLDEKVCQKMFSIANQAVKNAYPKSAEGYSASVLTKKGHIYPGVSYNSDTLTLTMHSEAVALAHAVLHGEKDIIAITGPNCHICKQLIWENSLRSGIDIIVVIKDKNRFKKIPISQLMPYPWPEK